MTNELSEMAAVLGRKGGKVKSRAKARAARENGKKGGRPRKSVGKKGEIEMKQNLMENYKEWRRISEEMLEDGYTGSIDCGEKSVREDFSEFAKLDKEISFEEMFELEKEYEDMEEE